MSVPASICLCGCALSVLNINISNSNLQKHWMFLQTGCCWECAENEVEEQAYNSRQSCFSKGIEIESWLFPLQQIEPIIGATLTDFQGKKKGFFYTIHQLQQIECFSYAWKRPVYIKECQKFHFNRKLNLSSYDDLYSFLSQSPIFSTFFRISNREVRTERFRAFKSQLWWSFL